MGGVVKAVGNLFGGGGGGGGGSAPAPAPAAQTITQSSIPEYARPYVETMLGQAQGLTAQGYQPYYGQRIAEFSPIQQRAFYDVATQTPASQLDTATGLATASGLGALGVQPRAAMLGQEALGYGAAGAQYGGLGAETALGRAEQAARQARMYGGLGAGYGAQGLGYGALGAGYGAGAQRLGLSAADLARAEGLGYGALGAGYGAGAAGLAPVAQQYGQAMSEIGAAGGAGAQSLAEQVARQATGYGGQLARSGRLGLAAGEQMGAIGSQGLGLGALGTGYGARGAQAAEQGFGAGEQYARMATSPEAMGAYMSPYMQQAVDRQKFETTRDYAKQLQALKAQAVGAGAFGGSRQAIVEAEAQRNLNEQLQNIQAAGTQRAFEQAQQAQQFGAGLGLQGLQAGYGGLGLGMQGAGVGLSGLGTALQGQQGRLAGLGAYQQGLQAAQSGLGQALGAGQLGLAGTQQALAGQQGALSSLGQAGQLYGLGMQGAGMGLQGLQGALAGSAQGLQGYQAGMQGAGVGLQGLSSAMQGAGLGLQGVGQQLGAGQLGLAGTGQGIAGAQAGLQGVQGALGAGQYGLAGLGQAGAAAGTLGQLGQTQFAQEQAINQAQQQVGAVQQAQAQQALDMAYQDFLKQRNYPYQQLAFMSDMLRGLPLSQSAQQVYTAPPSLGSQLGGLGMAGLGLYGMSGGFKAKGGVIKEKKMAGGGLAYASGGDIKMMSTEQLQEMLDNPTLTPMEVAMIEKQLMLRRRMEMNPESDAIMERAGITSIPTGNMVPMEQMAGGGIVAFANGDLVTEDPVSNKQYREFLRSQVMNRLKNLEAGPDPFAESKKMEAETRQQLAERRSRAPYEALTMAGLGTLAGTSQYGLTNLGLGALEGMKTYGRSITEEDRMQKELMQQGIEREKAKYGRDIQNLNALQTSLGQMDAREIAAMNQRTAQAGLAENRRTQQQINAQRTYDAAVKAEKDNLFKQNKAKFNMDYTDPELEAQAIANVNKRMSPAMKSLLFPDGMPAMEAPAAAPALPPPSAKKFDVVIGGKTYTFPTQEAADTFKKRAQAATTTTTR